MARISKDDAKMHRTASALVAQRRDLTGEERELVLEHWQESSSITNGLDGAFFTPEDLASDFRLEVGGERVLDLCAGIGALAYHVWMAGEMDRRHENRAPREIVCVEKNPAYVEVGRKILPEARWICGDVFDLPPDLGDFDTVIGNPPFGHAERTGDGPRYTGRRFEYHVIDAAASLARRGVFIIPQGSAPFEYSGARQRGWRARPYSTQEQARTMAPMSQSYERFVRETGIELDLGIGIDTGSAADQWRGTTYRLLTEVVRSDFEESGHYRPGIPPRRAAIKPRPVPVPAPQVQPEDVHDFADGRLF